MLGLLITIVSYTMASLIWRLLPEKHDSHVRSPIGRSRNVTEDTITERYRAYPFSVKQILRQSLAQEDGNSSPELPALCNILSASRAG